MTEKFTITKIMVIADKVVPQGFVCCVVYQYQRDKGQKIFDIRDQRFSVDDNSYQMLFGKFSLNVAVVLITSYNRFNPYWLHLVSTFNAGLMRLNAAYFPISIS